jgi:hypothetical protein
MGRVIISFNLNENGDFSEFRLEKSLCGTVADSLSHIKNDFAWVSFIATRLFSGSFASHGFKAEKDHSERYYIPLRFCLNRNRTNYQIKDGWLKIDAKFPDHPVEVQKVKISD